MDRYSSFGRSARRALKFGGPAFVAIAVVAYLAVSYLIASGVTDIDRKPLEDNPSSYGLRYEDVEFAPSDAEVTLRGWFIPTDTPRATLILVTSRQVV